MTAAAQDAEHIADSTNEDGRTCLCYRPYAICHAISSSKDEILAANDEIRITTK